MHTCTRSQTHTQTQTQSIDAGTEKDTDTDTYADTCANTDTETETDTNAHARTCKLQVKGKAEAYWYGERVRDIPTAIHTLNLKRPLLFQRLCSMFFNIKTVVDIDSADKLLRSALEDHGLKLLTDSDLKKLQERIGNTNEKSRIKLGFVDFFGFSTDFFKFLVNVCL